MTEPAPLPAAAPAPSGAAAFVAGDAAAGRAYLSPTAFTAPRGSASVNAWFPGLPLVTFVTVGYGVTDRLEVSAGGVAVLVDGDESIVALGGKLQLLRGETGGLAAQVQFFGAANDANDDSITLWSLVGSKCLDPACRTVGTLHLTGAPISRYRYDSVRGETRERGLAVLAGGSLVTAAGAGNFKLVLDGLHFGDGESGTAEYLTMLYGGVRYASPRFSGDLGFVAWFSDDDELDTIPVPLASVSARW